MKLEEFKKNPILGILRGVGASDIEPLVETVVQVGLGTIEITMNTEGASDLIKQMVRVAGKSLTVGAGTVLTKDDLHKALDAGASFIVLPTLVEEVVSYCAKHAIPVFPGALTPQEIYNAWRAGATMVKVFPAKFFGPTYFKEIKGPFSDIELLACGGVNPDNIATFFSSGAAAVAFGGSIFKKEWLKADEFKEIGSELSLLIKAYRTGMGG